MIFNFYKCHSDPGNKIKDVQCRNMDHLYDIHVHVHSGALISTCMHTATVQLLTRANMYNVHVHV